MPRKNRKRSKRKSRKVEKMAKTKYRYRTKVKRSYSRGRGGGGKYKAVIDGLLAGVAAKLAKQYLGNIPIIDDVAMVGVGAYRKNQTLMTLGGVSLAADLINMTGLGGNGSATNGGFE